MRERGAAWLAAFGDHATLQKLAREDEAFMVRKSAMEGLALVPVTPAVAAFAWEHLHAPGTSGAHASETLRTYVAHAPDEEARSRLLGLARSGAREARAALRAQAVTELCGLEARPELARLIPILEEEPAVTWSVHLALLDAALRLDLPLPALLRLR